MQTYQIDKEPLKRATLRKLKNINYSMKRTLKWLVTTRQEKLDTYLLDGSKKGRMNDVKTALNDGADVNAKGVKGWTPLITTAYFNYLDIGKFLVRNGAIIDLAALDGKTALMMASITGNEEMCRFLLDNGADLFATDKIGMLPCLYARFFNKSNVENLLLSRMSQQPMRFQCNVTPKFLLL